MMRPSYYFLKLDQKLFFFSILGSSERESLWVFEFRNASTDFLLFMAFSRGCSLFSVF